MCSLKEPVQQLHLPWTSCSPREQSLLINTHFCSGGGSNRTVTIVDGTGDYLYHSVIHRLVSLIYQRAHLEAEVTAVKRQAEQANKELQRCLDEDSDREVCEDGR